MRVNDLVVVQSVHARGSLMLLCRSLPDGLHFTMRALRAFVRELVSSYYRVQTSGCVLLRQGRQSRRSSSLNQQHQFSGFFSARCCPGLHEYRRCSRRCCVARLWCSCWCTVACAPQAHLTVPSKALNVPARDGGSQACLSCPVQCGS